jgi:hypothetical protein
MERRPDQFIGDAGAVVLGGVDVIDAELHRAAQLSCAIECEPPASR